MCAGVSGTTTSPVSAADSDVPVYQEVWFIALIAILALIILFILLACCLRRTAHKVPYIRERMPLYAKHKKLAQPLSYVVDPYTGSVISTVSNRQQTFSMSDMFGLPVLMRVSESAPHRRFRRRRWAR